MKHSKRSILIIGGTGGIGKEVVHKMIQEYNLIVFGINKPAVINQNTFFKTDIRKSNELKKSFKEMNRKFGKVSGIINCAGINNRKDIFQISDKEWCDEIETNLNGAFYLIKEAIPYLLKKASIVNMGSIMSHYPTRSPAYAASKAGLEGLTISLSKQLSNKKIRINLLSLGPIKSEMISKLPKERIKELEGKISLGRLGSPKEVANVVSFLMSDESSYINGQVIKVDGGFF